ncbi:hypothetical protein CEUSTIGMA_g3804.t1 [Chlamydomonas eustigma]|uniref:NAD-dependent epimerase/dehydratase domain-containing protein n=1 Tax=Chlamydomonas eustigma TaxID=1157962 RepID=A0A250WZU5_9CHLO|nr:hypothetical protein CEUSTIGMA_g3804.t1 [Chlamydomonas eustigma]|eukprot:GAX76358.1 hypothetical protein CEUSTIGMA_g3804.t1 [Chlamydomonas eustigma]
MLGLISRQACGALNQSALDVCVKAALSSSMLREYAQFALANAGVVAGPGGRSSASGLTATVFGGYGFIGSYIVNDLGKRGSQIVIPTRATENKVQHIRQMGDLGQIVFVPNFDIRDETVVKEAISRSNVVINLIGQRTETMNFKYEEVHSEWPKRLATIVAEAGHVERLIHFSDMGADLMHTSRRMRSKAQGDLDVQKIFPSATIFKPGPVVGIEDYFYNYIVYQVSYSLIAPLVENGSSRLQPTYVLDVADAVSKALMNRDTMGKTYYLGGPEVLTYREIYDVVIKTLRLKTDDTIPVPAWAAKLAFAPKDWARRMLPSLPMSNWMFSSDYIDEMMKDKITPRGALGFSDLGIMPTKVTEGLPIEPVRHYRVGGYSWGDMANVAKDVPEAIRKYYNLK